MTNNGNTNETTSKPLYTRLHSLRVSYLLLIPNLCIRLQDVNLLTVNYLLSPRVVQSTFWPLTGKTEICSKSPVYIYSLYIYMFDLPLFYECSRFEQYGRLVVGCADHSCFVGSHSRLKRHTFDISESSFECRDVTLDLLTDAGQGVLVVQHTDRLSERIVHDVIRASYVRRISSAQLITGMGFTRENRLGSGITQEVSLTSRLYSPSVQIQYNTIQIKTYRAPLTI